MSKRFVTLVWLTVVAALTTVLGPSVGHASDIAPQWGEPGVHAIMRHALAPGISDPASFDVNECSTQRNLDDRGREQARSIGSALREGGISFDRILTSQWCRCRETAQLLDMGPVADLTALNSFFEDRSTAQAQTDDVRSFLAALPDGERVMLVTHQVNITALTGRGVSSGEVLFFTVDDAGKVAVVGNLLIRP